ncbi:MAG: DUF2971 domain-containing protein [Bacteroidetes bacterium]|nr:DUF2971 domain-containing protein [Bacteroidota bacterium]
MDLERNIRINKVLRELNISLERGIDILKLGGFEIEPNPNSKISEFEYSFLKYRLGVNATKPKPTITGSGTIRRIRDKKGIPYSVFKYYSTNKFSLESFELKYLYHSNYKDFNDPFDCNMDLICFEKEKKRSKLKKKEVIIKENFSNIGICCFSRNINSILMWSHYAENHKGFCLEFYSNRKREGINPLDVNYVDIFLKASYYENKNDAVFHMIFTKAQQWEYEEELRSINSHFTDTTSRKVPFLKEDIKAIYLGVKIEDKIKKEILAITKEVYENKIQIFAGNLSPNSFEIHWDEIKL